jgi:translation initiation factor 2B subunit (eIF-2B alpha/beta/delta family)/ADP-ribose pyrophosphatase YjhB (NUDIX family)
MDRAAVVTCFLRHDGEVLLLRRADDAETYPGRWGTVTGYVEHAEPLASARMEIREETALTGFDLARRGEPFEVRDPSLDRTWEINPFLFDAEGREIRTNEETARAEWTTPTDIRRRETVPDLWRSYDRVRPTPETVAADGEHGSAYISIRALEVVRDEAALAAAQGGGVEAVWAVAEALLEARPSMAALGNRVNRAVSGSETPEDAENAAIEGIERALGADGRAAECAAETIEGHVLTLSRSGTVLVALRGGTDARAAAATGVEAVTVAESRPAREGVDAAETLATAGLDVRVCTDAAVAGVLAGGEVDCVLVGADTVLPDGRVVNKTGTRGTAIAAGREDVPVYVATASDKISPGPTIRVESGPPDAVYDGDAGIEAINPTFDVTPAEYVDAVFTERGVLSGAEVADIASELRELGSWQEKRDR